MAYKSATDNLRALEARQAELSQELTELSASRRALLLRHALLSCWCEALSYVQLVGGIWQPDGMACDGDGGRFEQLLTQEVQLLQQLSNKEAPLGAPVPLKQLLRPDSSTIAPSTDPMAYLTYIACQSPSQATLSMDGQALATIYMRDVPALGMKLHQLATATPNQVPGLIKQVADIWETTMQCNFDLIMSGDVVAVEEACMYNLETMQLEPAAAAAHQAAQAAMVVPLLQLTEQQQELIPIAVELFHDLLAVVLKERQEINSQLAAMVETAEVGITAAGAAAAGGKDDGSPSGSRGRSQSVSGNRDTVLPDHGTQLQQQEELTNRLNQLLHKEYKLRLVAIGWFVGSLTYEQLSRLAVACWPYSMRAMFIAREIMQQSRAHAPVPTPPKRTSSGA